MATAGKKTTATRRAGKPAAKPPAIDLTAAREFVAARLPGAEVNSKFGGASFYVGGKVFAFSRPKGLVLKLAPEVIAKLIADRGAQHLVMGKRAMREWALLPLAAREGYVDEVPLLKIAMAFVRALEDGKR
jgi:hypothetical protein